MVQESNARRVRRPDKRTLRRAGMSGLVVAALATSACSSSEGGPVQPVLAGTIQVSVVTSGFMQDDSYEILLDGVSQGQVSASGELVLTELNPDIYEITLGDVADNCTTEGVTIELGSEQTADASFEVLCAFGEAAEYTLRFSRARPDLNDGTITECPFGLCPTEEGWDMYVSYTSGSSIVRVNGTTAVELAHVSGRTLDTLTDADYDSAVFTMDPIDDPFDANRVILVRTDTGDVYALGNPVEDTLAQTLTFDAVLVVTAS